MIGAPFEPIPPGSYVPRVKNLMTGLAATDAEIQAVVADPTALRGLVDQWQATPDFQAKMLDFFRNAFQQNQVNLSTLEMSLGYPEALLTNHINYTNFQPMILRNMMDSFPLTAQELIKEGRPFNETITTRRYMMTTAMMALLAYLDANPANDGMKLGNNAPALAKVTYDANSTATLAQTLNPADPNYMVWPILTTLPAGCTMAPVVVLPTQYGMYYSLFTHIWGAQYFTGQCGGATTVTSAAVLTAADFSDWRMVTIHQTDATTPSETPPFWDILKLRTATDLTVLAPHVGFFGTPAFAANWTSNAGNESRVTANQTLIVSIGRSINGENVIAQFPINSSDAAHASDMACQGCHGQLDPLKQYFRQSQTFYYANQTDTTQLAQQAGFNIDGVSAMGQGVGDLAATLAAHPRMPLAWADKLQFWANSTPAIEDDPELVRIAMAFQQSGYDWKTLVREVFSSPLVTYATATKTATQHGVLLSIARRDHFCAALSNRLGLTDVCGKITLNPTGPQQTVRARTASITEDTYYRGYELPSLPTDPDLFFRGATEAACTTIADLVVDTTPAASSHYVSTNPTPAIADFVANIMAIAPSDPKSAQAVQILTDNFTAAQAAGGTKSQALKSTFILACESPSSVLVGL
jgi:hypothetical protein